MDVNQVSIALVHNAPEPPSGGFGLCYNFGPDGTQFSTPVTIKIPLDSTAPDRSPYRVFFYDQARGVWSEDGVHNPATKVTSGGSSYLIVDVNHFSDFEAGGDTASSSGGGGGGGGCALTPWSHGDPMAYVLPFAAYVLMLLGLTYLDSRRRAGVNRRQP
jgi:hypothetical protein